MLATLAPLHQMMKKGPQTAREVSFLTTYGSELHAALGLCKKYALCLWKFCMFPAPLV